MFYMRLLLFVALIVMFQIEAWARDPIQPNEKPNLESKTWCRNISDTEAAPYCEQNSKKEGKSKCVPRSCIEDPPKNFQGKIIEPKDKKCISGINKCIADKAVGRGKCEQALKSACEEIHKPGEIDNQSGKGGVEKEHNVGQKIKRKCGGLQKASMKVYLDFLLPESKGKAASAMDILSRQLSKKEKVANYVNIDCEGLLNPTATSALEAKSKNLTCSDTIEKMKQAGYQFVEDEISLIVHYQCDDEKNKSTKQQQTKRKANE